MEEKRARRMSEATRERLESDATARWSQLKTLADIVCNQSAFGLDHAEVAFKLAQSIRRVARRLAKAGAQ